jgi:catechol 1,2-dioxygenase
MFTRFVCVFVFMLTLTALHGAAQAQERSTRSCALTRPDALGPFYKPNAPVRAKLGDGYILSGVVRSGADCEPVRGARVEVWMADPTGTYRDEFRATLPATGPDGTYRLETVVPTPYTGRPPHIHVRVTAPGFETLVTQHYNSPGVNRANFDLVLRPSGRVNRTT